MGGTYAVCPSCKTVIMCGYLDDKGLNPRVCGCGAALGFNDYFQPVERRTDDGKKTVDPSKDPAVTVAELCAYQDDGVPAFALASWIAILAAKGLLKTGAFLDVSRFEIRTSGVESGQLNEALQRERWTWIDPRTRHWNVKLGDRGRSMLEARGITLDPRTRKEIERLRGRLSEAARDRLKSEAVAALAKLLDR